MSNQETVSNLYAAFQRQDIPAILECVADDVDWRNDGVASRECPWNGDFSGKAKLPGFFQTLAENLDFKVFDVKSMVASGPAVAVNLRIESVLRKNGRELGNDSVHIWMFDGNGKVASYRHFNDTAAELSAWRGEKA
jgi:ketosteroid isomerase-like protein